MALPFGGHDLGSAKSLRILLDAVSQRSRISSLEDRAKVFLCHCFSDQAFFHPERDGNGVTPPESTSVLGV